MRDTQDQDYDQQRPGGQSQAFMISKVGGDRQRDRAERARNNPVTYRPEKADVYLVPLRENGQASAVEQRDDAELHDAILDARVAEIELRQAHRSERHRPYRARGNKRRAV